MNKGTTRDRRGKDDFRVMKAERTKMNVKAVDLAKALGISRQWLYKLEYKKENPSEELKKKIEVQFGIHWELLSKDYDGEGINARICPECKGKGFIEIRKQVKRIKEFF